MDGVRNYNDDYVLDLDLSLCKHRRPPWLKIMFTKLFQDITKNNQYFVIDADAIFLKPFPLFSNDDKPIFFFAWEQDHQPYFNLMKKLYGYGKLRKSFICEMMMFQRDICRELLLGMSIEDFWAIVCGIIGDGSKYLFDDYDFYGNYCMYHYPTLYDHKDISLNMSGGRDKYYTAEEIQRAIDEQSRSEASVMTLHTWL